MEQFRLCWPEEQSVWGEGGLLLLVAVEAEESVPARSLPCRVLGRVTPGAPALAGNGAEVREHPPAQERVSRLLTAIGMPPNLLGFGYLRTALTEALRRPELLRGLNRRLYPEVARRYGVSAGSVERAIRHAISQTWARGGGERCRRIMGRHVSPVGDRPTNGEMIALLADRLAMDGGTGADEL
ncbi:MAG: sporulation initiation factor Spo0A C-terminal domain-containing protein [Clostridia bacterium]|nr:sporulation initiation factor Spo0A C-terminal domain-containing protein [Clostridia bacterium]